MTDVVERAPDGTFLPGQSGNKNGRPLGRKNKLTVLKQDLEIAIREKITTGQVRKIVDKMAELAADGNVGAAKLILDKVISNAKEAEEEKSADNAIQFTVKNLTLQAAPEPKEEVTIKTITPEEIEHVDRSEEREPAPQ